MAAAGLKELLGETFQLKDSTTKVEDFAGKFVGLYFSAHWCPPCKGFTPELVKWYNAFKASDRKDEMEIVFISSDRDEESFKEYYGEMPWHSLPYSDRDRKTKISKKFKVSGIPTFLILDADSGEVMTKDGRNKVGSDEEGKDFPWKPMPLSDMLKGSIITKDGPKDLATQIEGKIRAIYFSAHWCPPCRGFTPDLIKSYKKLQEDGKNFEILFVSWDRDEEAFEEYYKDMPWASYPRDDPRAKNLGTHFEVDGIPSLVILDEENQVITSNGRGAVSGDPECKEFPWVPKPMKKLTSMEAGLINEAASLIYLAEEGCDCSKFEEVEKTMKPIAEKYICDRKENSSMEELNFFCECEDSEDLPDSLRSFATIDAGAALVLFNIPEQQKYVLDIGKDPLTPAQVEDIVSKFKAGTLEYKGLRN